jgi:hypothetical protein
MASIDKMDWHYGGDYPEGLPEVNAGTHIGMYLAWVINNDLIGQLHREDSSAEIQKVLSRQMTGREFLIAMCDEKFWADDLNEEGLAFTNYYYQADSTDTFKNYIDDYVEVLGNDVESIYEVADTWENYEKLQPLIDKKFSEWQKGRI